MLKAILVISIQFLLVNSEYIQDSVNNFWQLTDIHWDLKYHINGNKLKMCHEESTPSSGKKNGRYGDYLCDSPWPLVNATLHNMKAIEAKPNFILWTGDNAPHTGNSPTLRVIFNTINNVTKELISLFGKEANIIPVLGNHDTFPANNFPATSRKFYGKYLDEGGWSNLIPSDGQNDFKTGGYFKYKLSSKLSILVLNTNLYCANNKIGMKEKDPANQFQWMRKQFDEALRSKSKVFVTGHAPPGYFERLPVFGFFTETYNELYVNLLNEYGSVIVAQIYGHLHTDTFRIFGTSRDNQTSVAFMAPSVSPWFPTRMVGGTGINPSIRLYEYNFSSVLDYTQYHMNLSKANNFNDSCSFSTSEESNECEKPRFEEYYKATELFNVDSLNINGMMKVYGKLSSNDSFFQNYYVINSAGYNPTYCNETCKRNYLCSVAHLKTSSLKRCTNDSLDHFVHQSNSHPKASKDISFTPEFVFSSSHSSNETISRSFMTITVCLTAITSVLVLFISAIVLAFSYKRKNILASGERLSQWSNLQNVGYQPLNVDAD